MRLFGSRLSIVLLLVLGIASCTSSEDRIDAAEVHSAFCTDGASELSPRLSALCLELRERLQSTFWGASWELIAQTGRAAADRCPGYLTSGSCISRTRTSTCIRMRHHSSQSQ